MYRSRSLALHNLASWGYVRRQERANGAGAGDRGRQTIAGIETRSSLPRLAWLATLQGSAWSVLVGEGIEQRAGGFFEGVWHGDFAEFRPDRAPAVFGSGAVVRRGRVVFVPPSHPLEPVFALTDAAESRAFVSNSLPFLLEAAGLDPHGGFAADALTVLKQHVFEHFQWGVDRARTLVHDDGRYALHVVSYFPFEVTSALRLRRHWTAARREFRTFAQYRDLLHRTTRGLIANATAPERAVSLAPLVAVSRGYDSVATAAVVAAEGGRRAVTIQANVQELDDSGAEIAAGLGLEVVERPHVLGAGIVDLEVNAAAELMPEAAEFFATVGIGDMIAFLPFERELADALFFTGIWGDGIWTRDTTVPSGYPAQILFNKSVTEFRLRVGFAHILLPVIGGRFTPPARALSVHPTMQPYSIGGHYDRPLPRRLAEEAGVPREAFGQRKNAQNPRLIGWEDVTHEAVSLVMARYRLTDALTATAALTDGEQVSGAPRLLLCQIGFRDAAGSEIVSLELLEWFVRRGWAVDVFTAAFGEPIANEVADHIAAGRVRIIPLGEDAGIRADDYALIWVNHAFLPRSLVEGMRDAPLTAPMIWHHMSSFQALGLPLLADAEEALASMVVSVSPETQAAVEAFGLEGHRIELFDNPAPDEFVQFEGRRPGPALESLLVVSNHPPAEVSAAMELLRARGVRVAVAGMPGEYARLRPAAIAEHDAVLTIGKTTQYALVMGVPVYSYDHFGGGGWITADTLERERQGNFSGRPARRRLDADQLAEEVLAGYTDARAFAADYRPTAIARWSLTRRLETMLVDARLRPRARRLSPARIARTALLCQERDELRLNLGFAQEGVRELRTALDLLRRKAGIALDETGEPIDG